MQKVTCRSLQLSCSKARIKSSCLFRATVATRIDSGRSFLRSWTAKRRRRPPSFASLKTLKDIGQLAYFKWQDGGYVLGRGLPPVAMIRWSFPARASTCSPLAMRHTRRFSNRRRPEFRQWSAKIDDIPAVLSAALRAHRGCQLNFGNRRGPF